MRYPASLLALLLMLAAVPAHGGDVALLATCTTKVFGEINRTQKWSGKPPAKCPASITVEKRTDGVLVTAWVIRSVEGGWIRTAFSGAMGYGEIAGKKELARAGRDIVARAKHLERCLDSINATNDPLDCRDRATKSYTAGEESGVENDRIVWLDDNGRHAVLEYAFGNTSSTPSPPADLFNGQPLPPGVVLDLRINR
ncbi:hypothetical protein FO488_18700 [Geobacter sp. FeAm09]|uniref:hypothetical protein n=1 Tax=Geobacter sp. FeAm09 TaxID=2597769 RepID=UPI0011EC4923|nr:hypothetical protein [Geobacter sp. FeAm09]QEM69988.1 hypothetical protein FO488_18700 [Geobacter sp. FeAm09]